MSSGEVAYAPAAAQGEGTGAAAIAQAVLDAMPVTACMLDADGRVAAVNERWCAFGQENGAFAPGFGVGTDYVALCRASDDAATRALGDGIATVLDGRRREYRGIYTCHAPWEVRWFRLVARPVDVAALPGWLLVTHLDISARVLADASLRAADRETRSAHDARLDLIENLGDEMRTPLNAIIGLSELMAGEQLGPLGSDLYRSYASDVLGAGRRLRQLVDALGEFNDIQAGRVSLTERRIDLGESLQALAGLSAARAAEAGVSLTVDVPSPCARLVVDVPRFQQMVGALLDNALRYTPAGGSVTVLAGQGAADDLMVTVADTGPGIPAHDRLRVQEPFSRGATGREEADGLGLGLPLARALVELHGGRLMLKVRQGGGTAAILRFPPERVVGV